MTDRKTPVYTPDAEISAALDRWLAVSQDLAAAGAIEEAAFASLCTLMDRRLGEGEGGIFVGRIGDPEAEDESRRGFERGKAGRSYHNRDAGTDWDQVTELARERLHPATFKKYFIEQQETVVYPNREALEADRAKNPKIDAVLTEATSAGTPTLTRVKPAAASAAMAKEAAPLPPVRLPVRPAADATTDEQAAPAKRKRSRKTAESVA